MRCEVSFLDILVQLLRGFHLTMGNPQVSFILYSRYNYHNGLKKINCMLSMFLGGSKGSNSRYFTQRYQFQWLGTSQIASCALKDGDTPPPMRPVGLFTPEIWVAFWVVNVGFSPAFHHNQHRIWPFHKRYIHYYWVVVSSIFF